MSPGFIAGAATTIAVFVLCMLPWDKMLDFVGIGPHDCVGYGGYRPSCPRCQRRRNAGKRS